MVIIVGWVAVVNGWGLDLAVRRGTEALSHRGRVCIVFCLILVVGVTTAKLDHGKRIFISHDGRLDIHLHQRWRAAPDKRYGYYWR